MQSWMNSSFVSLLSKMTQVIPTQDTRLPRLFAWRSPAQSYKALVQLCYCLEQPLTSQYLGDFLHRCTYLESRPEHGHIYTMSLWPPLQVLFSVCMIYCARQILVYLWVSAIRKRILSQHVFTYSLINCTAKKILQPQQLYSFALILICYITRQDFCVCAYTVIPMPWNTEQKQWLWIKKDGTGTGAAWMTWIPIMNSYIPIVTIHSCYSNSIFSSSYYTHSFHCYWWMNKTFVRSYDHSD